MSSERSIRVKNTTSELYASIICCELGDYSNVCAACVGGSGLPMVCLILQRDENKATLIAPHRSTFGTDGSAININAGKPT